MPIDDHAVINSTAVGLLVSEQAERTPADANGAQIDDAFARLIPKALEDYRFCASGEGEPFIAAGNLSWPNGCMLANTADGLLSEAYLRGLKLVIEEVRQMRGTPTRQIGRASTCLVTSGSGGCHNSAANPGW
jgi:hypothetical protein